MSGGRQGVGTREAGENKAECRSHVKTGEE